MSTNLASILKEIHRLRRYAKDLETKIAKLPKTHQKLQDDVEFHTKNLKEGEEHLKHLKVQNHENEVSLQSASAQIDRYQKQREGIISKKEFDALGHEIDHTKKKISDIEDQILQGFNNIEEQEKKIPPLKENLEEAKMNLADFEKEMETKKAGYVSELEKTQKELEETESSIPSGDFKVQYDRLVRIRGDDAFASVKNNTCQSCFMGLTAQQSNEMSMGKFNMCNSCGRIMYLAD